MWLPRGCIHHSLGKDSEIMMATDRNTSYGNRLVLHNPLIASQHSWCRHNGQGSRQRDIIKWTKRADRFVSPIAIVVAVEPGIEIQIRREHRSSPADSDLECHRSAIVKARALIEPTIVKLIVVAVVCAAIQDVEWAIVVGGYIGICFARDRQAKKYLIRLRMLRPGCAKRQGALPHRGEVTSHPRVSGIGGDIGVIVDAVGRITKVGQGHDDLTLCLWWVQSK